MTANTKAKPKMAANLDARPVPKLLDLLRASREEDAAQDERERQRQEQKAEDESISSALEAESKAFHEAGLHSFDSSDARGYTPMKYYEQSVTLINTKAHPSALLATALTRAQRVQAFARIFEQSQVLDGDADAQEGSFTLARMAEEVVEMLVVLSEHDGIKRAPLLMVEAA